MEKIAKSLERKIEYFLLDDFAEANMITSAATEIVFYTGEPSKE